MAVLQVSNKVLRGIGASSGIVTGKAFLVDRSTLRRPRKQIDPGQVDREVERFLAAVQESKEQLLTIKEKILDPEVRKHAFILDTHLMILDDRMFLDDTIGTIREKRVNAEWALDLTLEKFDAAFHEIEDEYLKERRNDLHYISRRIFRNLLGKKHDDINKIRGNVIVVARDLSPADTLHMNLKHVTGFITDIGGKVSHTAILSRSLGIPSVLGLEVATSLVSGGDLIVLDGETGEVVINPTEEVIRAFMERKRRSRAIRREALKYASLPAETRDGVRVRLQANIEMPEEVSAAKMYGAEGVGLFRTELLFLSSRELPGEEEQYQSYRKLVESLAPAAATIRTIDIGGDKLIPNYPGGNEVNPAMGLRAIRFSMKEIDLFRTQLRAILRASAHGRARILFPMISGIEEVRKARTLLRSVMDGLRRGGAPFCEAIEVGVMIEVPSASITADILAKEVDFFSIGTNDLIQYALAIDRVNEHVSYLYEPLHPAVLRIIRGVVQAGRRAGIPVALCGEIAAEPAYALILLGLGLEDLSMTPVSIPKVKKILRMARFEETRAMVDELFQFSTAAEISGHVRRWMAERFPNDVLDLFPGAAEEGLA